VVTTHLTTCGKGSSYTPLEFSRVQTAN
jgi:hypothetical protein